MIYRMLIVACCAALVVVGCGDDEEESTPVATPDGQTVADASGAEDTAATDTATPDPDTQVDINQSVSDAADTAVSDTAVTDTAADIAQEEILASDTAVEPETLEDVASSEDGSSGDVPPETTAETVTFSKIFTEVFGEYSCGNGYCHGAGAGGFSITDETGTHFALVNQNAMTGACGLSQLVVPGDPESSILWRRLRPIELDEGDVCAPKMPQGSAGIDAEGSQLVYDWIAQGALP